MMQEQESNRSQYTTMASQLNQDQKQAFDEIVQCVSEGLGGTFYLKADAGCGKTFLLNVLTAYFRQDLEVVSIAASTGIAAIDHSRGRTAHNLFKIPVVESNSPGGVEQLPCNVAPRSQRAELLRASTLIIWDEISMQ